LSKLTKIGEKLPPNKKKLHPNVTKIKNLKNIFSLKKFGESFPKIQQIPRIWKKI
jgi:hypothetical protein